MVKLPKLKQARLRKPLTQDELAEQSGVSKNTILRIEKGADTYPQTVRKLATALGVEADALMGEPD
jgi:transcriptional regulator with XRE-family HTH domain